MANMRRHLALLLCLSLAACGGSREDAQETPSPSAAADASGESSDQKPPKEVSKETAPAARALDASAGTPDTTAAALDTLPPPSETNIDALVESTLAFIEHRLTAERSVHSRDLLDLDSKLRGRLEFGPLLQEVYGPRDDQLLFHEVQGRLPVLSDEGRRVVALLREMPSHGLPAADYRLDSIEAQRARYEAAKKDQESPFGDTLGPREAAFWERVSADETPPAAADLRRDLLALGLTDEDLGILKKLQAGHERTLVARAAMADAAATVDVDLLQGFFRFQLDFVHQYKAHPFKAGLDTGNPVEVHGEALRAAYQTIDGDFVGAMRPLIPDNPIYDRLRAGLVVYERLAAEKAFDGLQLEGTLMPGKTGEKAQRLTQRLAAEGYLAPEHVGDSYTKPVRRAVKWYQRTHQLERDGRIGPVTGRSLNVPAARRADQIRLGLLRWRESEIHRDRPEFYIRVNIPQFEAEVWDKNELVRTHRLVVGNHRKETNISRGRRGYFNHTALLKSEIKTIVLKPRWYPPSRIQQELLAELEEDPAYFETKNFGFIQKDDGREIVYQKPGPENAMGRVKILFPNDHDVYLHDTPKKGYFNRPIRSHSHGCMRTEHPLKLAQYLLQRSNGMSQRTFDKTLEKDPEEEAWIRLKNRVPIYVEYNSVSADPDGKVHFFIDIYRYDQAYWDGRLPVENSQELTEKELKRISGKGGASR